MRVQLIVFGPSSLTAITGKQTPAEREVGLRVEALLAGVWEALSQIGAEEDELDVVRGFEEYLVEVLTA